MAGWGQTMLHVAYNIFLFVLQDEIIDKTNLPIFFLNVTLGIRILRTSLDTRSWVKDGKRRFTINT